MAFGLFGKLEEKVFKALARRNAVHGQTCLGKKALDFRNIRAVGRQRNAVGSGLGSFYAATGLAQVLGQCIRLVCFDAQQHIFFGKPFGGIALRDGFAAVDDAKTIGQLFYFRKDVGGDDDGFAQFGFELAQDVAQVDHAFGVEAVGGFVEDNQFGLVEQGLSNSKALFHTLRKGFDGIVSASLQSYQRKHFLHLGVAGFHAVHARTDIEVAQGRKAPVEIGFFDDAANLSEEVALARPDGFTAKADIARVRGDQAEQAADRR